MRNTSEHGVRRWCPLVTPAGGGREATHLRKVGRCAEGGKKCAGEGGRMVRYVKYVCSRKGLDTGVGCEVWGVMGEM